MRTLIGLLVVCCAGHTSMVKPTKSAPCYSECGMLLEKDNKAIQCARLDEAEHTVLKAFDSAFCATDNRYCIEFACNQLFGWQLQADKAEILVTDVQYNLPDGGAQIEIAVPVSGLSTCRRKEIWLGSAEGWRASSFAHEIAHAITECEGGGIESAKDRERGAGHEGWTDNGVFDVLFLLKVGAE